MTLIGDLWWLWLLTMVVSGAIALYFQLQKMRNIGGVFTAMSAAIGRAEADSPGNPLEFGASAFFASVFSGMAKIIIPGAICSISFLLLIISVIVNIVELAKA